ncbi:MAG: hypothetical protein GY834_09985, partial [Bacteroidetes bacterium]|nr:hypothetical protein [Bacteroidota bacterium]
MSQDILVVQNSDGIFDIQFENGDLKGDPGLTTAVNISLFTDSRAPSDIVSLPENQRGWMGNLVSTVIGRELGGLVWLTDQRRLTQDTLNDSIDYSNKALEWMVTDGLLTSIDVTGEIIPRLGVQLKIILVAVNGITETRYFKLWEA